MRRETDLWDNIIFFKYFSFLVSLYSHFWTSSTSTWDKLICLLGQIKKWDLIFKKKQTNKKQDSTTFCLQKMYLKYKENRVENDLKLAHREWRLYWGQQRMWKAEALYTSEDTFSTSLLRTFFEFSTSFFVLFY